MTSEKGLSVRDAVAMYKELTEVESGFRQLKDVLALAADLSPDRDTNQGSYFCGGVGVVGSTACWAAGSTRRG